MRIAILTLPLITNYGGVLQAYALRKIIENTNNDVVVLKHNLGLVSPPKRLNILIRYLVYVKRFAMKFFCGKDIIIMADKKSQQVFKEVLNSNNLFIRKYIKQEEVDFEDIDYLKKFDAIIVGSDQVWRPVCAEKIEYFFLGFLEANIQVKRIAYAASFGTDEWEYSKEETSKCAELIKRFNSISVREQSAVGICKDKFGVKPDFVLDPTMLLNRNHYEELVNNEKLKDFNGEIFCYILDSTEEKCNIIKKVSKHIGKKTFRLGSKDFGVLYWLKAFMDAKFIITDSFHGSVFSIIFNKPFIAIGNKGRGMARFNSLFSNFNLQDRLIFDNNFTIEIVDKDIDWRKINVKKEYLKRISMDFILNALNNENKFCNTNI